VPTFPAESELRRERLSVLETFRSLRPDEFESAPTLCSGWAPRDVLSHLLGQEEGRLVYATSFGRFAKANERIVVRGRARGRGELLARAALWARFPSVSSRIAAYGLLGETAIHHQDVLRPLGRRSEISDAAKRAMLCTAAVLGPGRLLGSRVVPSDLPGCAFGVGRRVAGPSDALALWLSGRGDVEDELEFA
jgi:uncharacterized protein (TIGR03083 family)